MDSELVHYAGEHNSTGAGATAPRSPSNCPACGRPNACVRAADPAATDCWCKSVVVPPQLLAQVREKFPSAACLCRACLERESLTVKSAGL